MKKTKYLTVLIPLILISQILVSCGGKARKTGPTAEESFRHAMDKFNRGKYLDASEELTLVTLNFSGSSLIDSAQFYLGESHFRMKEYIVAADEFGRLIDQYPSSPLVDNAKYKIGLSYYLLSPNYQLDQEYTRKALKEFQEFTEMFPESDLVPSVLEKIMEARSKLARKAYRSGALYYRMHDYEAAIVYFDDVLDNFYDTEFAPMSMLKKGECYAKMKRFEEAGETLTKLLERYPDSPSAKTAKQSLKSLELDFEEL